MKVWLVMLVERDTEGRMGGEIFQPSRGTLVGFTGTAQMLAAMEDMVPPQRPIHEHARHVSSGADLSLASGLDGG